MSPRRAAPRPPARLLGSTPPGGPGAPSGGRTRRGRVSADARKPSRSPLVRLTFETGGRLSITGLRASEQPARRRTGEPANQQSRNMSPGQRRPFCRPPLTEHGDLRFRLRHAPKQPVRFPPILTVSGHRRGRPDVRLPAARDFATRASAQADAGSRRCSSLLTDARIVEMIRCQTNLRRAPVFPDRLVPAPEGRLC